MARRVLAMRGFSVSDFMPDALMGKRIACVGRAGDPRAASAWRGIDVEWVDFEYGESQAAIDLCKERVSCGQFKAIVVVDLSDVGDPDSAGQLFEDHVGPVLQTFVREGGVVAFPTCEGLMLQPTLNRLFQTGWEQGGYYRTTWEPCASGNPAAFFGNELASESFSAKACSIRKVPPHERMFGTAPDSVTQSHVFCMSNQPVGQRDDPESVVEGVDGGDRAVSVAIHAYGAGSIAYFGDVNCEGSTAQLVAAYLCTPGDDPLDETNFRAVLEHKARGNAAFGGGRFQEAIQAYDAALAPYEARAGSAAQRDEKVKILSNRAECYLRLDRWADAEETASLALELDASHSKSLLRRARARMQLGGSALAGARLDLRMIIAAEGDGSATAAGMLRDITARLKSEKYAARDGFRTGFAAAISAEDTGSEPIPSAPPLDSAWVPYTPGLPEANSWATGLNDEKRYEWLVDCYRMRCDDDYVWGGGNLHGLYNEEPIAPDFLVFCLLAVERGAVPSNWDWTAFLEVAATLLPYAFEKQDAKEKWGGENIFSPFTTGGRSLRHTAQTVYGSTSQYGSEPDAKHVHLEEQVRMPWTAALCGPVGGLLVWKGLCSHLGEL